MVDVVKKEGERREEQATALAQKATLRGWEWAETRVQGVID